LRTSSGLIKWQVWTTGGLAGHGERTTPTAPGRATHPRPPSHLRQQPPDCISWWSPAIRSLCALVHAATTTAVMACPIPVSCSGTRLASRFVHRHRDDAPCQWTLATGPGS
jgi:hypothetical protein